MMKSNDLASQEQGYFANNVHETEEEQEIQARLERFLQPEKKDMSREEHSPFPALQKMDTFHTQGSFRREPLLDAQQLPRSGKGVREPFTKQPPGVGEARKTSDGSSESDSSSEAEDDWDSDHSVSSVEAAAHSTPMKSEDSLSHSSVDVVRSTPTTTVTATKAPKLPKPPKPPLPPGKPSGHSSQAKKKKQNGSNSKGSSSKIPATNMPERYRRGAMPDRREFLADRGNYFALYTLVEKQRKLWVERVVSGRAEASLNSMMHDSIRKAKEAEAEIYKSSKNLEEYNASLLTYSTLQAEKVQNGVNRKAPF